MAEPAYRQPPVFTGLPGEADLPYEDDEPLAESDYQLVPLTYAFNGLKSWYKDNPDVAVQADMFVHYLAVDDDGDLILDEDGNPTLRKLAPDVFVILGVPKRMRWSYVVWDEGKPPDFVMEVLSRSTWRRDIGDKKTIYEKMGVKEFWLVDPVGVLDEPLTGYRLVDGWYRRIPPLPGTDATFGSEVLDLELAVDASDQLRIQDARSGAVLKSHTELTEELAEAMTAHQREAAARQRAEDARVREAVARQREAAARQVAEEARQREAVARQAAERRAEEAERRLAELLAERRP